jgi:hypothetical protein
MTKSSTSNVSKADRVKLLQAVTKSVNKVAFNPSKARKDEALEAIDSLRDFVVAQSKPKAEPKPKASGLNLDGLTKSDMAALIAVLSKLDGSSEEEPSSPQPKAAKKSKPKAKRKAKAAGRKRTASEVVADSDEIKAQPKAVGPISKGKKKSASVAEAKEKVASLGKRNAEAKASKIAQQAEIAKGFKRLKDESPEDAIRRFNLLAQREALEAALLAGLDADGTTGQIELNF